MCIRKNAIYAGFFLSLRLKCGFSLMSFSIYKVYMYDFSADQWTKLPSMQKRRYRHGCGLARKSDGTVEAVVAGGYKEDSVEIYNFDTNTWRYNTSILRWLSRRLVLLMKCYVF